MALYPTASLNDFGTDNLDLIRPVEEVLGTLPDQDSPARAMALAQLAVLRLASTVSRADYEDNLATADAALAMAERIDSPDALARALMTLADCLQSLWQPRRALKLARRIKSSQTPAVSGGHRNGLVECL
jgi:hypothetical protein